MKWLLAILVFIPFSKGLSAQALVHEKVLENGFTVIVFENHEQPQAYGAVVVKAGAKHDPADATGMAHYLEHMLFKGTTTMGTIDYEKEKIWLDSITFYYEKLGQTKDEKNREQIQLKINELSIKAGEFAIPNEVDRMLAEIGSLGVNAYTTFESTVYHNTFPSNQLEKWMDIYSHRFQEPVFRLFQAELETVYEEKNRKMDDLGSSIFEYYLKHFFKSHPYGQQTIIGETEHLKNPPLKKMYDYFNTYYVANNMALIVSGDVTPNEVFALAEKKFASLKAKPIPTFKTFDEKPFNGREVLKIRKTPVKAGVIGYRIPPNKHPDITALNIVANLLSNSAASGSVDQLINDNKIMMGGLQYMPYNDGGTAFLYFVPKILVQSMGKAERLMMKCIEDVKKGNFTDEEFEAVKSNMTKQIILSTENNTVAANNMINDFVKQVEAGNFLSEIEKIKSLTKQDVIAVANTYFGENSLAMYSRMGFPKKDKLKKPPFKPVIPKNEVKSSYYQKWKNLDEKKPVSRFVDFKKDIDSIALGQNCYILKNKNPFNNIVSMSMIFGVGKHDIPILEYADKYITICGTTKTPINDFNAKLYTIGCSFTADVNYNQVVLRLNFPEEHLKSVMSIMAELLHHPSEDKAILKKIKREIRTDKLLNKRSTEYWSDALTAYALYGKNSPFLTQLSFKDFKKYGIKELSKAVRNLSKASLKIYYTGNLDNQQLTKIIDSAGFVGIREQPSPIYTVPKIESEKNIVYLLNSRKARQSQIECLKVGNAYTLAQTASINGFNKYFGGDMSSLMFQEIREFRSLAYSTSASYSIPGLTGIKCTFSAYAGTQNDKTNECVDVLYQLVNNMPFYEQRFNGVKSSLLQNAQASRPGFRSLISTVESWKRKGYSIDPSQYNLEKYQSLTFNDITSFYQQNIQPKPTAICITGKLRSFNTKKLNQYGKVIKIKKRKLVH